MSSIVFSIMGDMEIYVYKSQSLTLISIQSRSLVGVSSREEEKDRKTIIIPQTSGNPVSFLKHNIC